MYNSSLLTRLTAQSLGSVDDLKIALSKLSKSRLPACGEKDTNGSFCVDTSFAENMPTMQKTGPETRRL